MRARQVLTVLPTYNERENLEPLVRQLLALRADLDVLVIDDASPDGSGKLADQLAAADPRVCVIHREAKLGLGTAYLTGFRWGLAHGYSMFVQMDCDFSHRVEDVPRLLEALERNDVALGSRYVEGGVIQGWSWVRRLVSRGGSFYARLVLGGGPRDYTGGFKAFRGSALSRLALDSVRSNGYAFQVEVNYACWRDGMRVAEVPIVFRDRTWGQSKMSWAIAVEAALLVLGLRAGVTPVAVTPSPSANGTE